MRVSRDLVRDEPMAIISSYHSPEYTGLILLHSYTLTTTKKPISEQPLCCVASLAMKPHGRLAWRSD